MVNILSFIKNGTAWIKARARRPTLNQTNILAWGTVAWIGLMLFILFWDGYLFYQSLSPTEKASVVSIKKTPFTSDDINDAIQLLDEREQMFNTILHELTGTSTLVVPSPSLKK